MNDLKTPAKGKTYCINEGSCNNWYPEIQEFVKKLKGRSVRWMCCMVADVHRPLLQGGCFLYPECRKYPKGRLRLVYEAMPLAYLWERCNPLGRAVCNLKGDSILDLPFPKKNVHTRVGVIFLGETEAKYFDEVLLGNK